MKHRVAACMTMLAIALAGCGSTTTGVPDAGAARDGGALDGGLDGGALDGGALDGGLDAGIDPTDPRNATRDSDCDGISDADEISTTYAGRARTDPLDPDTDGDGILDGVEVGRTSSPDPSCTSFVGDADRTTTTNPTAADSDGDGIPDGVEDANRNGRVDPGETDPASRDTDRDGVPDPADRCPLVSGPAAAGGCPPAPDGGIATDTDGDGLPDADERDLYGTNPAVADTDGDGLSDGQEVLVHLTDPLRRDTDCDGLTDGQEVERGTDPRRPDTDGDGLPDGLEAGVTVNPDPTNCPAVRLDGCPATTTDPLRRDSDGDGLLDGVEDANQNGCVDGAAEGQPAERDPQNPNDGQGGAAAQACRENQLREVLFKREPSYNVQTARVPSFAEVSDLTVDGARVGALYFDPTHGIAAFAISRAPAGGTAAAEEAAGRATFDAVGSISAPVTQSITTWDALPAVLGRYDWGGTGDLKNKVNAAVAGLLGNPPGLAGLFPSSAGLAGPHKLRVEYVRRSAQAAIIVGAAARSTGFDAQQEIRAQDVANGSALADAYDDNSVQCDRFLTRGAAKVDFLWVIDNSGSMADDQDALSRAADEMASQLANAQIDWRVAVAYTDSDRLPNATPAGDTCAGAPGPGRRRVCPFTSDITLFRDGHAACAYTRAGTCGSGSERGFAGAQAAIAKFLSGTGCEPVPNTSCRLRPDAQLVIIFFTDTGEQTTVAPPGQSSNTEQAWVSYFSDYDIGQAGAQRAQLHGILCPGRRISDGGAGGPCTDNLTNLSLYDRYRNVISAMGGVEGSIRDSDQAQLPQTISSILNAVIGAVSPLQLTKPPISATLKVVMERLVGGQVQAVEVPRDPANGFDFDGASNSIVLRGSFLPDAQGREVAVSYRYWIDRQPPPTLACPVCVAPRLCNPATGRCECPADCGGPRPSPRHRCDPVSCAWVCAPDCNATCSPYQSCDTGACSCVCQQNVTCPAGFRWNGEACACLCDTEALGCNQQRFEIDPVACTCRCRDDCGGCAESSPCNRSLCRCVPR